MPPILSIVVPVYNVAPWINQCLESVAGCHQDNIEIVVVDDHSSDESIDQARRFLSRYSNIKLIENPNNVGLGETRNIGLRSASGEFVMLLDSDDWIAQEAIDIIIDELESAPDTDLFQLSFNRVFENGVCHPVLLGNKENNLLTRQNKQKLTLSLPKYAWAKLYRRGFIQQHGLNFTNGLYEDIEWSIRAIVAAETIRFIEPPLYNYRQRSGSILTTMSSGHLQFLEAYSVVLDTLPTVDQELRKSIHDSFISESFHFLRHSGTRLNSEDRAIFQKRFRKLLRNHFVRPNKLKTWIQLQFVTLSGLIA